VNAAWLALVLALLVGWGQTGGAPRSDAGITPQYAGSASCRNCHAPIFAPWTRTRIANVVRDP